MKRRFFVSRSFDIYGGVAGLFDLGVYLISQHRLIVASRVCSSSEYCGFMASPFHFGGRHA